MFDLLRKVIQGHQFLGQFWTGRTVHWNIKFGARMGGTWRNRYPDPFWFQSDAFQSSPVPAKFSRGRRSWTNPVKLNQKVNGCGLELEWKRKYLAGIRKEPGCLFHYVACTTAPKHFYVWPLLVSKVDLENYRPWMTFLSRSNEGGQKFHFATEYFKCRPFIHERIL